ncbi:isoaspartyl peptidase/L-asparaginase family protein [Leptolyngbya sp. 7M]|uniref:isoaspartyl peptidase/L-asparaginase family protein n=1 Tax=Leptolyngbya sp. 7M TaxID=2812896 RepID=UPI001B8AE0D4|nr:isoaspartyl peptidase/L-asparaginase [Leptolyngbya sp. 7M]QYO66662.1 isoaspartyl peptidase/L-asparaginase [Leptolyngbya sp. 7M]
MKKHISILLLSSLVFVSIPGFGQKSAGAEVKQLHGPQDPRLGFIIHGGAGVIRRGSLTPEREKEYRAKLEEAVLAGYKALQAGRSGLDAIEIAIRIMEDSPLFNAGKGAVFTNDGKNELDASIMDGKTLNAGAVAGLHRVKNPITLARAVMEKSEHVMMIGAGAEKFAELNKIELVDPKYFWTQSRWDALQRILKEEKEKKDGSKDHGMLSEDERKASRYGTVGAVALDKDGNLAAGTSTGGMTNIEFDHNRYAQLSQMILDDTRNAALKNNYGGSSGFFKAAVDIYMHDVIAKTKEENRAQLKCFAGSAGAVIYDNGVLSSCENKPDVLNLRDYDWDFQAAWNTDLMKARRKEAGNGCFCTHESNCYYPSLPFNPSHLVKIKKLERDMKKAAKEMSFAAGREVALKA